MSVRIRPDLGERIDILAESMERSKSWVIEKALEEYLAAQAWQVEEIKKGIAEADAGRLVAHEAVEAWVGSWTKGRKKPRPRA